MDGSALCLEPDLSIESVEPVQMNTAVVAASCEQKNSSENKKCRTSAGSGGSSRISSKKLDLQSRGKENFSESSLDIILGDSPHSISSGDEETMPSNRLHKEGIRRSSSFELLGISRMKAWLKAHGVDTEAEPHVFTDSYIQESMTALKDGRSSSLANRTPFIPTGAF